MPPTKVEVLVLGAGISGLTAAYQLQQNGIKSLVIDKEPAVGGRAQSARLDGIGIDTGALFLTNSYRHAFKLIRDLGLRDQVFPIRARNGIVVKGRIYTLPPHSLVDLPRLLPLSSLAKLSKVMLEVFQHQRKLTLEDVLKGHELDTETVADFSSRRLDPALLDYLINPILQGIWYWDSSSTTKVALYLLLKQALTMRLFALKAGMGLLANSLSQGLELGLETQAVQASYDPASKTWKTVIRDRHGEHSLESKIILSTLPATELNKIFSDLPASVRAFFAGIRYTAIVATHLLLNEKPRLPNYYGLYYPLETPKAIAAVALQTNKWPAQARPDRSEISIYSAPEASRTLLGLSDAEIYRRLLDILESTYPFAGHSLSQKILDSKITRLDPALPVFDVGYILALKDFQENLVPSLPPGIFFAGDFIGGPHLEGAIISAEKVLPKIKAFLQQMEAGKP